MTLPNKQLRLTPAGGGMQRRRHPAAGFLASRADGLRAVVQWVTRGRG